PSPRKGSGRTYAGRSCRPSVASRCPTRQYTDPLHVPPQRALLLRRTPRASCNPRTPGPRGARAEWRDDRPRPELEHAHPSSAKDVRRPRPPIGREGPEVASGPMANFGLLGGGVGAVVGSFPPKLPIRTDSHTSRSASSHHAAMVEFNPGER